MKTLHDLTLIHNYKLALPDCYSFPAMKFSYLRCKLLHICPEIVHFHYVFAEGEQMQLLLNAGGPDRVSRVQMAEAVADVRGYSTSSIQPVSASSVCFYKDLCLR